MPHQIADLERAHWLVVDARRLNTVAVNQLPLSLDAGETEAIALSIAKRADLLIMDELGGRKAASHFNLNVIGLLGVLILAKNKGYIGLLKPVLSQLQKNNFYMSNRLTRHVLAAVGE